MRLPKVLIAKDIDIFINTYSTGDLRSKGDFWKKGLKTISEYRSKKYKTKYVNAMIFPIIIRLSLLSTASLLKTMYKKIKETRILKISQRVNVFMKYKITLFLMIYFHFSYDLFFYICNYYSKL